MRSECTKGWRKTIVSPQNLSRRKQRKGVLKKGKNAVKIRHNRTLVPGTCAVVKIRQNWLTTKLLKINKKSVQILRKGLIFCAYSTKNGRSDKIWTCDFLLPKQALYQAEPHPEGWKIFDFFVSGQTCGQGSEIGIFRSIDRAEKVSVYKAFRRFWVREPSGTDTVTRTNTPSFFDYFCWLFGAF